MLQRLQIAVRACADRCDVMRFYFWSMCSCLRRPTDPGTDRPGTDRPTDRPSVGLRSTYRNSRIAAHRFYRSACCVIDPSSCLFICSLVDVRYVVPLTQAGKQVSLVAVSHRRLHSTNRCCSRDGRANTCERGKQTKRINLYSVRACKPWPI